MSIPQRRADHLFHDTWLPQETRAIRTEVREFAETVLRPAAHHLNTTPESVDSFPHDLFRPKFIIDHELSCCINNSSH